MLSGYRAAIAPLAAAVLAFAASSAAGLPPGYSVTDLGTLGGGAKSAEREVTGINSKGEVVGYWDTPGENTHAFLWLPEPAYGLPAGMNDLGARPGYGSESRAYAIGDSGRVVCVAGGACYWQNGVWFGLGGNDSWAYAINNAGRVAGEAKVDLVNEYHAFLWNPTADLGDIGGRQFAIARALNDQGQVVGYARSPEPGADLRAFLWEDGAATWLGTFEDGGNSYAYGINNSGMVAGWAVNATYDQRAFVWEEGLGITDLGALGGRHSRCSGGINDAGQVVGWSETVPPGEGDQVEHAFVWEDGVIYDLNDLIPPDFGWVLEKAYDLNEHGQIAGVGYFGGHMTAFLLTPVPEPATLSLLALGGAVALGHGRRRSGRRSA